MAVDYDWRRREEGIVPNHYLVPLRTKGEGMRKKEANDGLKYFCLRRCATESVLSSKQKEEASRRCDWGRH